jgi:protein FAM50
VTQDNERSKKKKISKNPDVPTDFLPDKEREEKELNERLLLAEEFKLEQERIKSECFLFRENNSHFCDQDEALEVTYSYWDGTGHRKVMSIQKGTSIGRFLELAKQEFKELRGVSSDGLMFVKEDSILPHVKKKKNMI